MQRMNGVWKLTQFNHKEQKRDIAARNYQEEMTDFHLSRCYEPSISATKNRKMSRSDLAFQKLKKYEVKYKTNPNLTSVLTNSESVEANSESHIEQYKSVIPVYTGPRGRQQDLTTYFEASKHCLQKAEETGGRASLKTGNVTSSHTRPRNRTLIIDLKVDDDVVYSDDSKTELITNSFPNACRDRNTISRKKQSDAEKVTAQKNETLPPPLKISVNNKPSASDTSVSIDNLCRNIAPNDNPTDSGDHTHINSTSAVDKTSVCSKNMNEIKKVDLYLTDEMKEVQELSQSVEYCQKQNKNESLEQINCDLLSNKEKLSVEPETVRTEIFESNSEITSYEVPDISSSFHIDIRESLHLDSVVTPESSVTAGDGVPQNTDDKNVAAPASNSVTDGHLHSAISALCSKCKKSFKKQCKTQADKTYCNCNSKSTQTNINLDFVHHINNIHLSNTTAEKDVLLSPYSLFVYHYLLHGYSEGPIKKDPDPAVSFLDKSLMEQVNITQYLINSHHTVYNAYCTAVRNLSKNYQPVTLENTMQFIKHSKKKKRKKNGFSTK
ncbi:uncharacterized protein LOC124606376 [Schistocerca americana]|uniref:uncharacterized protein LOC124606376 n=1 Tax=Schistocerca americana TaxID=7009 RepID=UPI001F50254C|nr:uncharacterized protein LOC124606376 [Schistocerca americana]